MDCKHIHLTKIVNSGPDSTDYVCDQCRLHFHTLPGMKPITVIHGTPDSAKEGAENG